jgi:hypothetical protein
MPPDPAGEGVELAPGESDRTTTTVDANPEEGEEEPWLTRRQRRALQRIVSQALNRQAGTIRRRRHQRPKHYTGQREPVRVARERAARGGTDDT